MLKFIKNTKNCNLYCNYNFNTIFNSNYSKHVEPNFAQNHFLFPIYYMFMIKCFYSLILLFNIYNLQSLLKFNDGTSGGRERMVHKPAWKMLFLMLKYLNCYPEFSKYEPIIVIFKNIVVYLQVLLKTIAKNINSNVYF